MKPMVFLLAVASVLAACETVPQRQASLPIARSPAWFQCESAFECVVVYDSFCQMVPVNQRHAIAYQDWSQAEVERIGERAVCPDPGRIGNAATCYQGQCVSRLRLERSRVRPNSGAPEAPAPPAPQVE